MDTRESEIHEASAIERQLLETINRIFPESEEHSDITLVCTPAEYSASSIARAVEDADATLVSLVAYPLREGLLYLFLRINRLDPSHTVRSLERYGYTVTRAEGIINADAGLSRQRLEELNHYLNI